MLPLNQDLVQVFLLFLIKIDTKNFLCKFLPGLVPYSFEKFKENILILDTLSKLQLDIYDGFKCGGYYVFAEICNKGPNHLLHIFRIGRITHLVMAHILEEIASK